MRMMLEELVMMGIRLEKLNLVNLMMLCLFLMSWMKLEMSERD